jgi:hypothetical protein
MPQDSVFFDDFGRGEYGSLGSWKHGYTFYRGALLYAGWWTGQNVVRYVDGTLGPRCGLKDVTPTGVPTGVVKGMGYLDVPGHALWYCVGTGIYDMSEAGGGATVTYTGVLASAPTLPLAAAIAPAVTWVTSMDDKVYKLDHNAQTVTAIASSPGGRTACIYGERMIVAGTTAHPNRVYYSAPGDFTSWPAINFFDVGDSWAVVKVLPQRTHLLIAKQDGTWWVLTGVPGVNDVLRQVSANSSMQLGNLRATVIDDLVYFVPRGFDSPATHNGARHDQLRYLSFNGGVWQEESGSTIFPPVFTVTPVSQKNYASRSGDVLFHSSSSKSALLRDGAWSLHTFGVSCPWVVGGGNNGQDATAPMLMFLCDGGGASATAKFYLWNPTLDRPPVKSYANESVGDASDTPPSCSFTLPEWFSRGGEQSIVRTVKVDFRKWNTNVSATNHFDLSVVALRPYDNVTQAASAVQSFDEAGSAAGSTGASVLQSKVFKFGDQGRGNGFQLVFSNLRGVAIQKVQVQLEDAGS